MRLHYSGDKTTKKAEGGAADGKGGCPGSTGRMPGCLPVSRTLILASHPPAGSREQESLFCLGINWAGCGKIGRQAS